MEQMALYLCQGIEEGRLDYKTIFTNPKLAPLKDSVDAMLIADGFQDKIVPLI
jgi:hypothetical protein